MITAGIDLGAQPERTATARIRWAAGRATIETVADQADDQAILQLASQAGKTGIDCPFGWPTAFVDFVTAHHAGHLGVPGAGAGPRRDLTMRRTDLFVREQRQLTPLSVSADRIAHVAFRCAVLLAELGTAAGPVDRSGSGPIAEVYPAASLRSWNLDHRGYKHKAGTVTLSRLVDQLLDQAPWLDCTTHEPAIRRSDDIFDAVIAAMTARAAAIGQTTPPPAEDLTAATTEGWIHIPDKPISELTSTHPAH